MLSCEILKTSHTPKYPSFSLVLLMRPKPQRNGKNAHLFHSVFCFSNKYQLLIFLKLTKFQIITENFFFSQRTIVLQDWLWIYKLQGKLRFSIILQTFSASGVWALIYSPQVTLPSVQINSWWSFVAPCAKTCLKPSLCWPATSFICSLNFKVHLAEVNRYWQLF